MRSLYNRGRWPANTAIFRRVSGRFSVALEEEQDGKNRQGVREHKRDEAPTGDAARAYEADQRCQWGGGVIGDWQEVSYPPLPPWPLVSRTQGASGPVLRAWRSSVAATAARGGAATGPWSPLLPVALALTGCTLGAPWRPPNSSERCSAATDSRRSPRACR